LEIKLPTTLVIIIPDGNWLKEKTRDYPFQTAGRKRIPVFNHKKTAEIRHFRNPCRIVVFIGGLQEKKNFIVLL
jgi:hypothetical protein